MKKIKIIILILCTLLLVTYLSISFSAQAFAVGKLYYTVDRFEGKYAVLESDEGKIYNVRKNKLPHKVKVGDVFYKKRNSYIFSKTETEKRWAENNKLFDEAIE